ncbi:hypothetical protein ACFU8W_32420 [Streptomyces sp. NPDC057565]|uniref:hypothetical protein n=1 Tax=Streptomyces sp. NPDC057565 TaxID=3346169 RepID=UPI0036984BB6
MLGLTGWSLVPAQAVDIMSRLPGLMINVLFARIMIGKAAVGQADLERRGAARDPRRVFSFGQFALGAFGRGLRAEKDPRPRAGRPAPHTAGRGRR